VPDTVREIAWDDLDALRAEMSEEYTDWGDELVVDQAMLDDFGARTGDEQWIHVDVERAKAESPFGTTIAHGLLTLALGPRIRPPSPFKVVGQGSTLNYGSDGLRYLDPIPAGSAIHSRSRLVDVQSHAKGTRLTLEINIHVVGNDRPSMVRKAVILHTPPEG
jgi:acyl dehydratase